jgi:hypothetical protein
MAGIIAHHDPNTTSHASLPPSGKWVSGFSSASSNEESVDACAVIDHVSHERFVHVNFNPQGKGQSADFSITPVLVRSDRASSVITRAFFDAAYDSKRVIRAVWGNGDLEDYENV